MEADTKQGNQTRANHPQCSAKKKEKRDGAKMYTDTTFTYGSSIDLRIPGSGSKDGFEHSTYMTSVSKHVCKCN